MFLVFTFRLFEDGEFGNLLAVLIVPSQSSDEIIGPPLVEEDLDIEQELLQLHTMEMDSSANALAQRQDQTAGIEKSSLLSGTCPDPQCGVELFFASILTRVECVSCGQHHDRATLKNVKPMDSGKATQALKSLLIKGIKPKPGTDNVKVFQIFPFPLLHKMIFFYCFTK